MLQIKNISKRIENKPIVNSLSLHIEEGQNIALLGPNGAGKTTTIKMIMGIISLDSGDISIEGHSINKNKKQYLKYLGYVPDEPFFYEELKGMEFLRFTADLREKDLFGNSKDMFEQTIEQLEMKDFLKDPIHTYSLGMKKKLALLIALIHQPKLLIMDEPLNGLDPMTVYTIKNYLNEYIKKGNSVLFSTHMMDVVENFCSHIAVIKQGTLLTHQKISDLKTSEFKSLEKYFIDLVTG